MAIVLREAVVINNKIKVYMDMARAISQLSKDKQTKVGAVLISPTGRQIASGYNGFLRGANDQDLPTTRPEKYEYFQHAERNVLYNCLDEGIRTKNCLLICTLSPCKDCLRACYQSGIKDIVFDTLYQNSRDFYKQMKDIYISVSIDKKTGFTYLNMLNPNSGILQDKDYKDWYYGN